MVQLSGLWRTKGETDGPTEHLTRGGLPAVSSLPLPVEVYFRLKLAHCLGHNISLEGILHYTLAYI